MHQQAFNQSLRMSCCVQNAGLRRIFQWNFKRPRLCNLKLNELNGEADGRLYEVIILKKMQTDGAVCSAHRSAWFSPVKPSSGAGTKLRLI